MGNEGDTSGGTSIDGDVNTGGGNFIGRDKITNLFTIQQLIVEIAQLAEGVKQSSKYPDATESLPKQIIQVQKDILYFHKRVLLLRDALKEKRASDIQEIIENFLKYLAQLVASLQKLDYFLIGVYYPEIRCETHSLLMDEAELFLNGESPAFIDRQQECNTIKIKLVNLAEDIEQLMPESLNSSALNADSLPKELVNSLSVLAKHLEQCEQLFSKILRENWSLKEL